MVHVPKSPSTPRCARRGGAEAPEEARSSTKRRRDLARVYEAETHSVLQTRTVVHKGQPIYEDLCLSGAG